MHQTPLRRQTPPAQDHPPSQLTRDGHPRATGAPRSALAAAVGAIDRQGGRGGAAQKGGGGGCPCQLAAMQLCGCTYTWLLTSCSAWQQLLGVGDGEGEGEGHAAGCRGEYWPLPLAAAGAVGGAAALQYTRRCWQHHAVRACPGALLWWLGCGCGLVGVAAAGWAPAAAGWLHGAHAASPRYALPSSSCPHMPTAVLPDDGRHAALCRHLQLHLPCVCCWPLPCIHWPAACGRNSL